MPTILQHRRDSWREVGPVEGPPGMVWIEAGVFHMGSDRHYPEEAPVRRVAVEGFWIDRTPVTNDDFARFVDATGHVTVAERQPEAGDFPDADPALLVPGSLVFGGPQVWAYVPGAHWRQPQGPGSDIAGMGRHPVVHVAHADAVAYAAWAGKVVPSEAEWEFAARGGLDGADFAWGDVLVPEGRHRANTWQGRFPQENTGEDGYVGTSPVDAFPPNGYGLSDMIGNVWEWTADACAPDMRPVKAGCCGPRDDERPETGFRILKGGSHLCAPNWCSRYRPAARQAQSIDTSSVHIGFRCASRPQPRGFHVPQ
jgi:formylglycine-generating enzyme required for sulfatase activity